jgi:hypothetical protein
MKRLLCFVFLASAVAAAQTGVPAVSGLASPESSLRPSRYEQYCSGFISKQTFSRDKHVIGDSYAPYATRFQTGSTIYLAGKDFTVGDRYTILREIKDTNRQTIFPAERKLQEQLGHLYQELGIAVVKKVTEKGIVAEIEFACDTTVPGDFLVPFEQREQLNFRAGKKFTVYGVPRSKPTGVIVQGKEFDVELGKGNIAYVNLGAKDGVKPGDYLRIIRGYSKSSMPLIDKISLETKTREDTQVAPAPVGESDLDRMPDRGIGECFVMTATPESSTCLITRSLEVIELGDVVEIDRTGDQQ